MSAITVRKLSKTFLVKEKAPDTTIVVGGAPLTAEFAKKIGADLYSPDPQTALDYLNEKAAS